MRLYKYKGCIRNRKSSENNTRKINIFHVGKTKKKKKPDKKPNPQKAKHKKLKDEAASL